MHGDTPASMGGGGGGGGADMLVVQRSKVGQAATEVLAT